MSVNNDDNNIFMSSDWFREFLIGIYDLAPYMYDQITNKETKEALTLNDFKNLLLFYVYGSLSSENPFQDVYEYISNLYKIGFTPLDALNDRVTLGWLNDLLSACDYGHHEIIKGKLIRAIKEGLDADSFLKMKKAEFGID